MKQPMKQLTDDTVHNTIGFLISKLYYLQKILEKEGETFAGITKFSNVLNQIETKINELSEEFNSMYFKTNFCPHCRIKLKMNNEVILTYPLKVFYVCKNCGYTVCFI